MPASRTTEPGLARCVSTPAGPPRRRFDGPATEPLFIHPQHQARSVTGRSPPSSRRTSSKVADDVFAHGRELPVLKPGMDAGPRPHHQGTSAAAASVDVDGGIGRRHAYLPLARRPPVQGFFRWVDCLGLGYVRTYTYVTPAASFTPSAHAEGGAVPAASAVLKTAHKVLDGMPYRDVVAATAAIGALTRRGRHRDAVALFSQVLADAIPPNNFTFGTVLRSATALRDVRVGAQLHACVAKFGLCSNVFVGSALVDHYAKMGAMREAQSAFGDTHEPNVVSYTALVTGFLKTGMFEDALRLFRCMPERNVVSWNAMIGGCSQAGLNEEAVSLFLGMCREGVRPTESTFPCVLTSVANAGALGVGRSVHASAIKHFGKLGVYIGNSLVSCYARCGSLEDSVLAFRKIEQKNVVSWNSLIYGYAQNGRGEEALGAYRTMRAMGLKANNVTLLGLMFGCNHAGLVDEGYSLFKTAQVEQPDILKPEHYACVVDLLSRAKRFDDAKRFLEDLPFEPGIGFWKSMIGGCQIHWNKDLAESVARRIQALDPKDTSSYILLSNVYSAAGSWQSVSMIRRQIKEMGLKRITGCSWIEVQDKAHVFFNGDHRHPQSDEIYMMLDACLNTDEDDEHCLV